MAEAAGDRDRHRRVADRGLVALEGRVPRAVAVHGVRPPRLTTARTLISACVVTLAARRRGLRRSRWSSAARSACAVARVKVLRAAIGSMITGLQTMPSVAWVPLAIILFNEGQGAIMFVVVLGAAPSIANGIINGIDHVPPVLLRAGRVLGARGFARAAPRRDPGRAAVGRRRAEAGVGVRVAQPDGRRAHRRLVPATRASASCSTASGDAGRLHRGVRGDDRDPDHRRSSSTRSCSAPSTARSAAATASSTRLPDAPDLRLTSGRAPRSRPCCITSPTLVAERDVHALDDVAEEVVALARAWSGSRRCR